MTFDPRYIAFLIYFNRDRDYFECHEVMEELWLATVSDPLYKGLLQAAVGLFHCRSGNRRGSLMMFQSSLEKLISYPEDSLGIDLEQLKRDIKLYIDRLSNDETTPFEYYDLTIRILSPELAEKVLSASSELPSNKPVQLVRKRGPKHELRRKDRI